MGQQVINGLFLGSIYALFALGYTLVFGVLDILNLAHAAVFMVATFVAVALVGHGLHILVALPAAVLFAGLLGLVLERVAFRPLRARTDSNISGLISSLAAATIIEAVALEIWGPNITRFPFGTLPDGPGSQFQLFGGTVSRLQLTIIAVAVALFLALTWLVKRTRLGREVRAVAESPQAGGEYVELLNLGEEPLDLSGWRLEKRTSTGSLAGCTVATAAEMLAPGAFGLLTSEAWDRRYPVPAGTVRFTCGSSTLAGGLSDERPPEVRLLDPAGALLATFGQGDAAPPCPAAVERIDPLAPDQADNLACAEEEGTPGWCNSVTPPGWCT